MTISSGMWDVLRALAHQASHQIDTRPGNRTPGKVALIWAKYHAEVEAFVRAEKLQAVKILPEKEAPAAEKHAAAPGGLVIGPASAPPFAPPREFSGGQAAPFSRAAAHT